MNFNDFVDVLREHLEETMNITTKVIEVVKQGDTVYTAITVPTKNLSNNETLSATVYMEGYYDEYMNGKSMQDIFSDVEAFLERKCPDVDLSLLYDWNSAKPYLQKRLVNYELNKEFLLGKPYAKYGDLAVYFVVCYEDSENAYSLPISDRFLDVWKVTVAELYNSANIRETVVTNCAGMTILSNESIQYGAINILDFNALVDLTKQNGSIYLIPSSIHEWIVVPDKWINGDEDALSEMIDAVNSFCLSDDERLGSHPYYFDATTKKLYMSKDGDPMFVKF